jgi:carbonic anhydrase
MGVIQRFIDRNKEFVSKFRHGDKAMPPAQHLAVLTCMDARIHPEKALGLDIGDSPKSWS